MMYDTAIPFAQFWLRCKMAGRKITTLSLTAKYCYFWGSYLQEERWSFHASAENMFSGIRGISMGIEEIPLSISQDKFGIAIYSRMDD